MNAKQIVLFSSLMISISNGAMASDFCSDLGTKLKQQNNDNSINHSVRFNYTVSGFSNFSHLVEYKFDAETVYNDSNSNVYIDDDSTFNNYFDNQKANPSSTVRLKNCTASNNSAVFTVNRMYPALVLNHYQQGQLPEFNINFIKRGNRWTVSNVTSNNCVNLIHASLENQFRAGNALKNRHTGESFYSTDLKVMTSNEVCPAHYSALTKHFNNLIAGN